MSHLAGRRCLEGVAGLHARDDRPELPAGAGPRASEFESFFRANYQVVVRLAYGVVGERHGAEDVAQEVFLSAYRRFPAGYDGAAGWVRAAAVHLALNHLRGERRRDRNSAGTRAADLPSAEDVVIEREERAVVRQALGRLPAGKAAIVVMRHSGLSYLDIAEALGVKVGQVGTLLRRAESALRKEMDHAAHS